MGVLMSQSWLPSPWESMPTVISAATWCASVNPRSHRGPQSPAVGCSLLEGRRGCLFTAAVPLVPGIYAVTARARDFVGNIEGPGPTVTIRVV